MGSMTAFTDELVKLAAAAEAGKKALSLIKTFGKPAALVGAGAVGMHLGGKELDKYRLGRQVYEQMQGRQGA